MTIAQQNASFRRSSSVHHKPYTGLSIRAFSLAASTKIGQSFLNRFKLSRSIWLKGQFYRRDMRKAFEIVASKGRESISVKDLPKVLHKDIKSIVEEVYSDPEVHESKRNEILLLMFGMGIRLNSKRTMLSVCLNAFMTMQEPSETVPKNPQLILNKLTR